MKTLLYSVVCPIFCHFVFGKCLFCIVQYIKLLVFDKTLCSTEKQGNFILLDKTRPRKKQTKRQTNKQKTILKYRLWIRPLVRFSLIETVKRSQ